MPNYRILCLLLAAGLLVTQTGCWSSKEIEDLSMYVGMALDAGSPTSTERELDQNGKGYPKRKLITATVQIAPVKKAAASKSRTKRKKMAF